MTNCYANITTQSGSQSGGLCGFYAGGNQGSCALTNCYATINTLNGVLLVDYVVNFLVIKVPAINKLLYYYYYSEW